MIARFRSWRKPGAAVMFTAGPGDGDAVTPVWGESLYHARLSPEEYSRLLSDAGFSEIEYTLEDAGCDQHSVYLAR